MPSSNFFKASSTVKSPLMPAKRCFSTSADANTSVISACRANSLSAEAVACGDERLSYAELSKGLRGALGSFLVADWASSLFLGEPVTWPLIWRKMRVSYCQSSQSRQKATFVLYCLCLARLTTRLM